MQEKLLNNKIVFIAGTGRSGTTWLSNIVNYANDYQYVFEPFNPRKVPEVGCFKYRQYIRPTNNDSAFLDVVKGVFSRGIKNEWIDKFNHNTKSKNVLIKDIRANHFLKWIKVKFPKVKIVLLLRYPGAVAQSKMKLGWGIHIDEFLNQKDLVEDYFAPFLTKISGIKTIFDKHILFWCMENYVPLKQFSKDEIYTIFYEDLCINPIEEVKKLFLHIDQVYKSKVLEVVKSPSLMSRKDSGITIGKNPLDSYKNTFIKERFNRVMEILDIFGFGTLYDSNLMPVRQSLF